jgi:hypothetical protein
MGRFNVARNEGFSGESVSLGRSTGGYEEGEYGDLRKLFEELFGGFEGKEEVEGLDWDSLFGNLLGGEGRGSSVSPSRASPFFPTGNPIQYL